MMMMISLRTGPKASDGLELNWRCPYGHYVDACQKKNKQTNKQTKQKSAIQQSRLQIFANGNSFEAQKRQG